MIVQLTHPLETHELWADISDVIVMERKKKIQSTLITLDKNEPDMTVLVLKCGKQIACAETPEQIINMMKGN